MTKILKINFIILFITWFFLCSIVGAFEAECVSIKDGDTIAVRFREKIINIRLYGIDTPEIEQEHGSTAKVFLSNFVYNKKIEVIPKTVDKYGRTVGLIFSEGMNICQKMVEAGHAWVYRKYCAENFCDYWLELEQNAQKNKIGLWEKNNSPTPPWIFREKNRE
ncbi:MAG: thermonuclease family protein [Desulfamplus sp.]|nr:thermonuclease family protein [Desulfamplus sp.]